MKKNFTRRNSNFPISMLLFIKLHPSRKLKSQLWIANISQRTKKHNHQFDIENYRNEPNSRNSMIYIDKISQRTKKNRDQQLDIEKLSQRTK